MVFIVEDKGSLEETIAEINSISVIEVDEQFNILNYE